MKLGICISRTLSVMGILLAFVSGGASAADVAGVRLDDVTRVANQDLKLNGAGIRYKAIFKVYVAGLYLPEKKSNVADVLNAAGPRRVTITLLRDVSSEELGRGFMAGIQQNLDRTEKSKIIMQLQKFGEVFASIPEGRKGDVLTVDWLPGSGTLIQMNGKKISDPLPDVAFYNAILKIWLGDKPIDTKLKPAMLGEKPDDAPRGNV